MKKHMKAIMKKIQTGAQWSRYCLRSLFVTFLLMLTFGITDAWGATSSVNTANLWEASTDDANDRVVWTAPNVTFKLHNNGDGGNIELYLNDHILIQKNKTYKLEWEVAAGYTIEVQRVSVRARSTLKSYITVGSTTSGNIYGQSYTTVTSEALSLGNDGYVTIRPNQGADGRDDAIVHMDGITVTYTFAGLTYSVQFNANGGSGSMSNQSFSFDEAKNLTTNGFTRTNYKFLGWTTNSDGSGTFYKDCENVVNLSSTKGATVNLYAKWTNEQTVTFDGTADWGNNTEKYQPDTAFRLRQDHVTFSLRKPMKQYNKHSWGSFKSHEYFFLKKESSTDVTSDLRWWVDEGYTIRVSKISMDAKGNGNSYLNVKKIDNSASGSTEMKLYANDGSFGSPRSCSVDDTETDKNGNQKKLLFGNPSTALSNDKYFEFKFTTKNYEWQFKSITLTYTITPNIYTITLDDNGGHGGDGTHKVTYDAATGSLTNAPTLYGYNFTGYYTSGETKIFNADKSVVSGVSTYTDGSGNWIKDDDVELSAHWTANNYTITLRNQSATTAGTTSLAVTFDANTNLTSSITIPTKTNYTFDGYYTGENGTGIKIIEADGSIIASAGDDTYTDGSKNWKYAGDIILYANWTSKQTPRFTPDGFSSASTNAIYVGDVLSLTVADVSDGLAGDFTATYDEDYFSVTREGNTISIEALNAEDGKTVVFTQTENSSIFAATETYAFNVSKVANTMTIKDDCEKYVGQELTDVIGNINSNGTITTTSSAAGIAHYDIANDKIVVDNASAVQFGASQDVTIIINQAATYKYTAASETIVVTVKKYPNAITCSWGEWSKNVNFDSETAVTFSSNNDTGTPIVVTPSPASSVATYDGTNNKIVANHRTGDVTWEVSQEEDYKYQAATTKTLTVNVGTVYSNCYLVDDAPQREWSSQGNSGTYAFTLDQPGDTLFFDAERIDICVIGICEGNNTDWHIQYSTKMSPGDDDWTKLKDDKGNDVAIECEYKDTYYNGFKYAIPADARAIRFRTANVGSFGKKHIRNVKVGRKKWLTLENEGGSRISEIDMPINTIGGNVTRNTFYIDYSTCASKIKLVSNNSRIKFAANNSTTYEFDVENGTRKAIELTYTSPADAEEIEATITVYTPYEHETLTVNAETKGLLSTTLEYIGTLSYGVDHANMNATELFQVRDENGDLLASPVITLSSSATGVINTVSSNTAIDFLCGGSATITASYAGDATYAAASDLGQTITVNKLSDAISWSGVGDDGKIHVWADGTMATPVANANTAIDYTSSGANVVVSKSAGVYSFTTGAAGEITLTATSEGDCTYASVTDTKQVVVDHCRHFLVWDQDFAALPPDDEEGHIDFSEALTAYAVDSTGVATGVTVNYSMPSVDFAHIEDGVLYVTGTGSTTITATTVSDDKFAVVSKTIAVNVLAPGDLGATVGKSTLIDNFNNEAKSVSWTSGHVTFTLSGNGLYTDKWVGSKYFYLYARSSTYTYELTWTVNDKDVNGNSAYIINVKKLTLDVDRASGLGTYVTIAGNRSGNIYDSGNIPAGGLSSGDLNLGEDGKITITVETSDAFWSNIAVNNINVLYTLLPVINTENQSVDVTVCDDNKQLLDLSECASLADRSAHAALSYRVISDNASDAHITADKKFYANSVGSYTVRAAVPQTVCHNPNTAEFTITVTPAALSLSPTASDITYRQALSASTLTGTATVGGCAVAGTWAWSAPATVPYVGEDQPFAVVFTPSSDADNYSGFTTTALVDVKRAQFIFDGSGDDEENKENWAIVDNWQSNADPGEEDVAIIRHDVIIAAEVAVYSLKIEGESKVTVAPTGGLTVGAGGIIDATKDNFKLQAGTSGVEKGQTGYLRISPYSTQPMPEATVELFSIGYTDYNLGLSNPMAWQYVGYPIAEGVKAKSIFDGWIYNWIEQDGAWKNNRKNLVLQPFAGYATTQDYEPEGLLIEFNGQLVENGAVNIPLVCSGESDMAGWNAIANSFSAPIDITKLTNADFSEGVDATVYIFNTGSTKSAEDGVDGAGQYISIPINLAGEMQDGFRLPAVIPSMQGFFVKTNQAGSLTLDYKNVVWNGNYGVHSNKPLRVKSSDERTQKNTLQVSIYSEEKNDNLYMLESEDYSSEFENGYDARKMQSGDFNIFSIAGEDKLAVDATNSIIGTRVGVRTGEETAYTLLFTHLNSETEIALLDSETGETTDINEGTEYTFFAAPKTEITERFYIVERSNAPEIATDVDNVSGETKVQKFIKNGQMYILKNGVLYNATGAVVR